MSSFIVFKTEKHSYGNYVYEGGFNESTIEQIKREIAEFFNYGDESIIILNVIDYTT